MQQPPPENFEELASRIEHSLVKDFGHLIGSSSLWRALGYPTATAFQRAQERGTLDALPLFKIARRRGVFCLTEDLAGYLAKARLGLLEQPNEELSDAV